MTTSVLNIPRREMVIAAYSATDPLVYRHVGIIDAAAVAGTPEVNEYKAVAVSGDACETYVAHRSKKIETLSLTVSMMSNVAANLAVALQGTVNTVTGATQSTFTAPTGLTTGSVLKLPYIPDTTTIVVTDSNATPATLTEDTDWRWLAKAGGLIEIISDLGSYTEPLKVDGDSLAASRIHPYDNIDAYYTIGFGGGNEANSCKGVAEDFWRAQLTEESTVTLHSNADTQLPVPMELTFTLDKDTTRGLDATLGYFGKILIAT